MSDPQKRQIDYTTYLRPWKEVKLVEDLHDVAYHAEVALSAGQINRIQTDSVAHFKLMMEEGKGEPTKAMKFGSLFHKACLEGPDFLKRYRVMPEFTGLTKEGKPSAQSGEARAKKVAWLKDLPPDAIVVEQDEIDQVTGMLRAVMAHPIARFILRGSRREVSGFFMYRGVRCKIRADILQTSGRIADLKTTMRKNPKKSFQDDAWRSGYPIQAAFYRRGLEKITGQPVESFDYIVVSKEKPYLVEVFSPLEEFISKGEAIMDEGIEKLKSAIATNYWLPNPQVSHPLGTPPWADRDLPEPMESES